jgi:2-isopropylmalate synthase
MQSENISFSLEDKPLIARRLNELGIDCIEGGYAGSNPKEMQFFQEANRLRLKNLRVVAFGSTRRRHRLR